MTHIKLFRRGEISGMPTEAEYLAVISLGMDGYGEWVPSHTLFARTDSELKEVLRPLISNTDVAVLLGAGSFEWLALELGFKHQKSEWGKP